MSYAWMIGLGLAVTFGLLFGTMFGNSALGLSFGVAIGGGMGLALHEDARKKEKKNPNKTD